MGTKVQVMLGGIGLLLAIATYQAGEAAGMAKCGDGTSQSSTATSSLETSSADSCRYRIAVTQGQTLSHLALYYGTTISAIAKANGLDNPNNIRAGQVLCIP